MDWFGWAQRHDQRLPINFGKAPADPVAASKWNLNASLVAFTQSKHSPASHHHAERQSTKPQKEQIFRAPIVCCTRERERRFQNKLAYEMRV